MASEFEIKRKQKLFDDLNDIFLCDEEDDDVVCEECGSVLFKLNYETGVCCADPKCGCVVDLSRIED